MEQQDTAQPWIIKVKVKIRGAKFGPLKAFIDTGSDYNCISSSLVPSKYWEECTERTYAVNGTNIPIKYMIRRIYLYVGVGGTSLPLDFLVLNPIPIIIHEFADNILLPSAHHSHMNQFCIVVSPLNS